MPAADRSALTGQAPESLAPWLKDAGEPAFRAGQILEWLWKKKAASFDATTYLPAALRARLDAAFRITALTHADTQGSADTTRKFFFRLHDGR